MKGWPKSLKACLNILFGKNWPSHALIAGCVPMYAHPATVSIFRSRCGEIMAIVSEPGIHACSKNIPEKPVGEIPAVRPKNVSGSVSCINWSSLKRDTVPLYAPAVEDA